MNLTIGEIAELPLPAALFGRDGALVAATPEWRGAAPGSVTYRMRGSKLVVGTRDSPTHAGELVTRLLDALDAAALQVSGVSSLRIRTLATSLRLLAGRVIDEVGTSDHVVHLARAGIGARTSLEVHIDDHPAWELAAPEAAALVLVQLAVNAERHAGARVVTLSQSARAFHVSWTGSTGATPVTTSRTRGDRQRWGLGFARLAADALGGAVYAPRHTADSGCVATLELGVNRLALPVAAVRKGAVFKSTRAWDEETALLPATPVDSDLRLFDCVELAREAGGTIAEHGGWCAREAAARVWVAIPPDGGVDRAGDLIDGLAHERALWEGVPEPARSRIAALAALLGSAIGTPLQRAPALAWTRRMRELAPKFELGMPVPECPAVGALDPQVTAFLAAELGERFDTSGERMWLRVRDGAREHPALRALAPDQAGRIPIT